MLFFYYSTWHSNLPLLKRNNILDWNLCIPVLYSSVCLFLIIKQFYKQPLVFLWYKRKTFTVPWEKNISYRPYIQTKNRFNLFRRLLSIHKKYYFNKNLPTMINTIIQLLLPLLLFSIHPTHSYLQCQNNAYLETNKNIGSDLGTLRFPSTKFSLETWIRMKDQNIPLGIMAVDLPY